MLATAFGTLPAGEGWAYEFKWDGVRALVDVGEHGVRIVSRAGNDVTKGYPEVVAQASGAGDVLLDGEIVAFDEGRPSFERLQQRMHVRGTAELKQLVQSVPVTYVVFDVLRRFGVDLTARPYTERRATLERFAEDVPGWTLSPAFDDGPATLEVARAHGLEGVVAKRVDAPYRPGARSDDWRKLRFEHRGEFAVIGWEAAPEHPNTLSSVVLGVRRDGRLEYAGRVGSGLSGRAATQLRDRLTEQPEPAVPGVPPPVRRRRLRWVRPEVVVDVSFTCWTGERVLRQPVFRGIRTDKTVEEATGDA
jgi:bifunctional non-homologous end joining protein LigD